MRGHRLVQFKNTKSQKISKMKSSTDSQDNQSLQVNGAGTADAILLNDVEFTHYHTNETGTAIINGTVYLDKLQEVDSTVTVSALPTKIDYVSKKRK